MRWQTFQYIVLVFFFKQKTAYEMRISDWSSDVCSADRPANILGCNRSRLADNKPALAVELEACAKDVVTIENNLRSRGQLLHTVKQIGRESCRERVCQ